MNSLGATAGLSSSAGCHSLFDQQTVAPHFRIPSKNRTMNSWQPYIPTDAQPWNLQRVWTLHRRSGFAATWNELQRDLADGAQKSIDRILNGTSRIDGVPDNYAEMQKVLGDSAVASDRPERLTAWWVYQMYFSPDPLAERVVLMWHNHFATSNAKVKNLALMREQNETFRQLGLGDFKSLLTATLKHGAMLKWLDGDENRAGKANENLGRETLELFTLGVGNFTEDDVKNASRALTGWSVDDNSFRVRDDWHDSETKKILGQTGNFSGDDLIVITTSHPATAHRLAWRLCHEFLSTSSINDVWIGELALYLSENNLNIRRGVERILRSELFFSDENIKRRIVEPESFVIGAVRALQLFDPPASTIVLGDWVEQLGRKLFYPPNVGGWPGDRAWLNSRTIIARANFGVAMIRGNLNRSGATTNLLTFAQNQIGESDLASAANFYFQLLTGSENTERTKQLLNLAAEGSNEPNSALNNFVALTLASPESQLS